MASWHKFPFLSWKSIFWTLPYDLPFTFVVAEALNLKGCRAILLLGEPEYNDLISIFNIL